MSLTYGFCLDELSSEYNSAQFSDAFRAGFGDGVSSDGARLAVSINGFSTTVASGYALAAGRWLENDELLTLTIPPSGSNDDRTDALVVRVDYQARKAALELVTDVDPDKLPASLRGEGEYCIVLYLIRVPRGSSTLTPENVTDCRADPVLCGEVVPLSTVTGTALYVYNYLQSGVDDLFAALGARIQAELARVTAQIQESLDKADAGLAELDAEIKRVGGGPEIGELRTARQDPVPETAWLLCDGGPVPAEYPKLTALLGGTLPNLSRPEDRYRTYIFGG